MKQRSFFGKLTRIWKHRWMDDSDVRRAVPPELLAKLERFTQASEARHSGEIRICIEAGLPMSYLWRDATPRERAIAMFGKLRVWDTQQNNGVLIYLLLAENAIEIVADRAVSMPPNSTFWQETVDHLSAHLKRGDFERGLTQALEEISALLMQHFPVDANAANPNELSNRPDVR
ncbi:TPM domain-containing protein [Variovorax sp. PCZ-1]|uniref:TPM domain-containing protein n=1 Tax=Variovorax sp. PCZ-1 TaxID=2835533 RepID=UPI001BCEC2DC|nr:TPM domain-containing protein [Variovorax sp. PCZ-1]MBS7808823.1 TPM domain-containing protein [Variovorax sp. PCZ-1]